MLRRKFPAPVLNDETAMTHPDSKPSKVPTPDGRPIDRGQLNTALPAALAEAEQGVLARLAGAYRRLNEVLSGMHTGVRCGGTPHSHHSYDTDDRKP